jgi:hypothetical protein
MPQPSHKPTRRRRRRIGSYLYHASFGLFLLILGALLVGSAWGLGEQAWRTDHQRRWNMFALIAAYIALVSDPCGMGRCAWSEGAKDLAGAGRRSGAGAEALSV